jgi:hypothetical protein
MTIIYDRIFVAHRWLDIGFGGHFCLCVFDFVCVFSVIWGETRLRR